MHKMALNYSIPDIPLSYSSHHIHCHCCCSFHCQLLLHFLCSIL